jgi:hypothetical protein
VTALQAHSETLKADIEMLKAVLAAAEARADRVITEFVALAEERSRSLWRRACLAEAKFSPSSFDSNRLPRQSPPGDTGFGGARPHAVRPRTARTIQINKHAPMNPAIR